MVSKRQNIRFLRWGATGANHFFFPLGGKSLFLGADRGGEGDRKWVRMLVVPFTGKKRDLADTF